MSVARVAPEQANIEQQEQEHTATNSLKQCHLCKHKVCPHPHGSPGLTAASASTLDL